MEAQTEAADRVNTGQPLPYPPAREFVEPDWTRIPGYQNVSREDWESATWQRKHTIKNLRELKALGEPQRTLALNYIKDNIVINRYFSA